MRGVLIGMLAGLCLAAGAAAAEEAAEPRRITVSGEGSVEAVPDMATVRFGVTTEAKGAREAIDTNSRAMAAILERLEAAGIAPRDVQTSGFSVSPRWSNVRPGDGSRPIIVGFVAENRVVVRVRELERLGGILDEVARDGANSFDGLSFGVQEPAPLEDAARREAVEDAVRKARLYAEAAGVELGPLITLNESGGGAPMMLARGAAMMEASDAVPVAAGEVAVTARVTLVYAIAD